MKKTVLFLLISFTNLLFTMDKPLDIDNWFKKNEEGKLIEKDGFYVLKEEHQEFRDVLPLIGQYVKSAIPKEVKSWILTSLLTKNKDIVKLKDASRRFTGVDITMNESDELLYFTFKISYIKEWDFSHAIFEKKDREIKKNVFFGKNEGIDLDCYLEVPYKSLKIAYYLDKKIHPLHASLLEKIFNETRSKSIKLHETEIKQFYFLPKCIQDVVFPYVQLLKKKN